MIVLFSDKADAYLDVQQKAYGLLLYYNCAVCGTVVELSEIVHDTVVTPIDHDTTVYVTTYSAACACANFSVVLSAYYSKKNNSYTYASTYIQHGDK